MPWKVKKKPVEGSSKDWAILKEENGHWKIVGRSTSKAQAEASVRARYASENKS